MKLYTSQVQLCQFHPDTLAFFRGRRVGVTGGDGFIGSHLVEQLLMMGADVIVITRKSKPRFLKHLQASLAFRQCDINCIDEARHGVEGCDIVIHMAAVVGGLEFNAKYPASIFQDNMQLFFNILKGCVHNRVKNLSVCSSACVYARHCSIPTPEAEGLVDEPEPTNSGYGWAKRMQEVVSRMAMSEYGLPITLPRPYNAYGPRDNCDANSSHVIPALICKALSTETGQFEVWGDGSHSRSFLYVDDFARGVLEVSARAQAGQAMNIGANEEITIRDLAMMIAELASQQRGMTITPVFNQTGLTGQPRRCCDTRLIADQLGYKTAISLKEGLRTTVQWVSDHENRVMHSYI